MFTIKKEVQHNPLNGKRRVVADGSTGKPYLAAACLSWCEKTNRCLCYLYTPDDLRPANNHRQPVNFIV